MSVAPRDIRQFQTVPATVAPAAPATAGLFLTNTSSLLRYFVVIFGFLNIYYLRNIFNVDFGSFLGAYVIMLTACYPSYVWLKGRVRGIPFFPLFCLTYIPTFSLPLLWMTETSKLAGYDSVEHLLATLKVTFFLMIAMICWQWAARLKTKLPPHYYRLSEKQAVVFTFTALTAGVIFAFGNNAGWFQWGGMFYLQPGYFSILRTSISIFSLVSIFYLSLHLGQGKLPKLAGIAFIAMGVAFVFMLNATLVLANSFLFIVLAFFAYTIGSGKIPVKTILIFFAVLSLLHFGKREMRERYTDPVQRTFRIPRLTGPQSYSAFYGEWFNEGLSYLARRGSRDEFANDLKDDERSSVLERSSLLPILLDIQRRSPGEVPYLNGATYWIIPQMLVPRVINENKLRTHEGTYILNVHYGYQDRESTSHTTIGWGILNESYANFGVIGIAILGVLVGVVFGKFTAISAVSPMLSLRFTLVTLVLAPFLLTESPVSVLASVIFQSVLPVLIMGVVVMKKGD